LALSAVKRIPDPTRAKRVIRSIDCRIRLLIIVANREITTHILDEEERIELRKRARRLQLVLGSPIRRLYTAILHPRVAR